jgi:23S rRNA (cytidine1920-2'-O)/16S rRNA (cytidine1409-2'-O)-methyltransferase
VRRRLDSELVRRGLAASRTEARAAIDAGLVTIGGRPSAKPSTMVEESEAVALAGPPRRFVSRGGDKLEAAFERFGVDASGRDALDAGASTGGFTDVLLRRGAARVVAVDVGYGQLAWALRQDPRVIVMERTNVRDVPADGLPFEPSLVVADLSFISLRVVIPALVAAARPAAELVLLVKPQFEVGPGRVGSGGVVRDPDAWLSAMEGVAEALAANGVPPDGAMASPVLGPAGNVEFFLHAGGTETANTADLDAAVAEGVALRDAATARVRA